MAVNTYIFACLTLSYFCSVLCDLNLNEDEPCVTEGLNGTCVGIYRCGSASLTYIYANAGFDIKKNNIPALPDICSYKNNEPVVCCTDCKITEEERFREHAIEPSGMLIRNDGAVASRKCLEYFGRLPYPCRGSGNVKINKIWNEEFKCYDYNYYASRPPALRGRDPERWEFPHLTLIGYGDSVESAQWLCGGSVISERFILTAAHCTSTRELGNISFAALGLLKRTDPKEYWKIYNIKRIIINPEYKPPSKYNDIALLETETEYGDSGGPLQINEFKCQYTIVGVTSYGKGCGILGSAGMYTRVSHYVPWIESVVWPEETEAKKKKQPVA